MWPRRRFISALGAASVLNGAAATAWAQFRVEITGVGATQVPIVVAALRGEAAAPVQVSAVVRADLQRSGLFAPRDAGNAAAAPLDERSNVAAAEWRGRGVDALVAGSVTKLADGRFDVRFKLWDVVKGEELAGQSRVVLEADLRLAAHRIADEVHEKMTGERGIYSTRIGYVMRSGKRFTLHVTDADGERGQIALSSAEPIISPPGHPTGASWPMSPSRRKKPSSGCKTWPAAHAASWPISKAPTVRRPGRPTASNWRWPCRARG